MIALDATQQAIVAAPVKDRIAWLFEVTDSLTPATTRYWSTQEIVWSGRTYAFAVLPDSFRGVALARGRSELGIQAPSDLAFSVANPDHLLDAGDFIDGQVIVRLLVKAGASEAVIRSWKFTITDALSLYGQIDFTAVDFLAAVLDGDYPNTRSVKDIFAASDAAPDDNVCVPVPFGTAYVPLRSVYVGGAVTVTAATIAASASVDGARCRLTDTAEGMGEIEPGRWIIVSGFTNPANNGAFVVASRPDNGTVELSKDAGLADEAAGESVTIEQGSRYYVLGDPARTYTIDRVRSPRDCGLKSEWTAAEGYEFRQKTVTDAYGQSWRVMQPIIACSEDSRDEPDAPGFWRNGEVFHDMPVRFSRDDTAALTNPADCLEFVLQDMGVAAGDIDAAAQAAAKALFASRGLSWNGAFWYKQTREKALSCLLNMCHATLRVTDKLAVRPISRTPVRTVTKTDLAVPRSFTARSSSTRKNADCARVLWQPAGEAQDRFLQLLVPLKATRSKIADDALELPFVQDSQHAQRLGTLYFQPLLAKSGEVSFPGKATLLALEPDDVITIDEADYGGTYDVLIDRLDIRRDGTCEISGLRFTIDLDDWDDLSPDAVTVYSEDTAVLWQPAVTGPLTEKAVGLASYDAWGKEYLTVAPEPNRGRYTSLQDALNAVAATGGSLFLRNGTYDLDGPLYLPNQNIDITGENRDGVVVRNAPGQDGLCLRNLAKTFSFRNLTLQSRNTDVFTFMIRIWGDTAADNPSQAEARNCRFILADDAVNVGDIGIGADKSHGGRLALVDSLVSGGMSGVWTNTDFYSHLVVTGNTFTGSKYMPVRANTQLWAEICNNVLSDVIYNGIYLPGGAGSLKVTGNKITVSTSTILGTGIRRGIMVGGDRSNCQFSDNEIVAVNDCTGDLWFVGIDAQGTGHEISRNNIRAAFNSTGALTGIYLRGSGSAVKGNLIRLSQTGSGSYDNTGITVKHLENPVSDNILEGNYIDMVNAGAKDVGIYLSAACTGNQGINNLIVGASVQVKDLGTDNHVNALDGGTWE